MEVITVDNVDLTIESRFKDYDWDGVWKYAVVRDVESRMDASTSGELSDFILETYRESVRRFNDGEIEADYLGVMEVADHVVSFPDTEKLLVWAWDYDLDIPTYMSAGRWDVLVDGIRSTIVQAIADSITWYGRDE